MAVAASGSTSGDLTRREAATLRGHWSELTRYLTPPGVAWRWGDSQLSERLKHYLKYHGLIRRHSTVDDAWETTDRLWLWVIENAGDDEPVGAEAEGQETLPVGTSTPPARAARSAKASSTPPTRREARQVTLAGDVVESDGPVNLGEIDASGTRAAVNAKQDPTRRTGKEAAAEHPAQARLTAWVTAIGRLTRPSGDAYGGEPA